MLKWHILKLKICQMENNQQSLTKSCGKENKSQQFETGSQFSSSKDAFWQVRYFCHSWNP